MRRLALLGVMFSVCVLTAGVASADPGRGHGYYAPPARHHVPRHYPGHGHYAVPHHHHHHHGHYRPSPGYYVPYRSYAPYYAPYYAPGYGYAPVYRGSGFSLYLGF